MVFQDPQASLNPRKRVGQILATPLRVRRRAARRAARPRVARAARARRAEPRAPQPLPARVLRRPAPADRHRPRARASNPQLIVARRAGLRARRLDPGAGHQPARGRSRTSFGLTYIFVAHDLRVVRHVSDRIAVMYLGKIVELSPAEELYDKPIHPYTQALLSAIPIPDPGQNRERDAHHGRGRACRARSTRRRGCRFHTRCPHATEICRSIEPPLDRVRRRAPGRLPPPAHRQRRGDRRRAALAGESAERRRRPALRHGRRSAVCLRRRPAVRPGRLSSAAR